MSCYSFLEKCTSQFNNYDAVIFFGHRISKTELFKHIDSLAVFLKNNGLKKGDVFTVFLPTTVHSIVAFYALNKIGVISNIVHPLTPPNVLIEQINKIGSKGVFVLDILALDYIQPLKTNKSMIILCSNSDFAGKIKSPFFKLYENVRILNKFNKAGLIKFKDTMNYNIELNERQSGDDISVYLHGGGTTGESKIIKLSNSALNSLSVMLEKLDEKHSPGKECSLMVLPLFHAFGLGVSMHFSLCNGFCCIPVPKFKPASINRLIKRYCVTFIVGVPNMYRKIMEQSNFAGSHLKKLRLLFCGGDFLSEQFLNYFNRTLNDYGCKSRLMRGYGLTETSSVCCTNTKEHCRENSIGKTLDGVVMQIWDEFGNELDNEEIGEFVVSAPTLMSGYFSCEHPGIYVDKSGTEWIKTGDLGYCDKDGYYYFSGRKKRMIIISGFNVYPIDIESKVQTLPFIKEVCAIEGKENKKTIIKLFISVEKTSFSSKKITEKVFAFCEKSLPRYSCPKQVTILKDLPKTQMGKIDYSKLV